MNIRFHLWLGGRLGAVAVSGLIIGLFTVIYGVTPGEAMAEWLSHAPNWILNPWFKLALVPIGLAIIWTSLTYNIWARRRKVVDALAERLSWAIHHLLNRPIGNDVELNQLKKDYDAWCKCVNKEIENNPAYFSKADFIHFDRLGTIIELSWGNSYRASATDGSHDHIRNMLSLKFDRLRDIINWTQQRTR